MTDGPFLLVRGPTYSFSNYLDHFLFLKDAIDCAEKNGMFFIETSAKTADNINQLFEVIYPDMHFRIVAAVLHIALLYPTLSVRLHSSRRLHSIYKEIF